MGRLSTVSKQANTSLNDQAMWHNRCHSQIYNDQRPCLKCISSNTQANDIDKDWKWKQIYALDYNWKTGNYTMREFKGHSHLVNSLQVNEKLNRFVTASEDKTVRVWDTASGECIKVLKGHTHQGS